MYQNDTLQYLALNLENDIDLIPKNATKVSFNPRVQPNWVCDGEIVDKGRFDVLYTHESGVYYNTLGNVLKEKEDFNNLVDSVIDQIKEDINGGDLTAIDELLRFVPKENLIGYLTEEI